MMSQAYNDTKDILSLFFRRKIRIEHINEILCELIFDRHAPACTRYDNSQVKCFENKKVRLRKSDENYCFSERKNKALCTCYFYGRRIIQ